MSEMEHFEPEVFNTKSPKLKGHFEAYEGNVKFENGEPEFDVVREEIATRYGVPFEKETHVFIGDNELVNNQRHQRAFSIVRRKNGDKTEAWYIDGRLPHAVLLRRLYNFYGIPKDDENEVFNGFLDSEAFEDIPEIQERAKKIGKPITWFIRETVDRQNIRDFQEEI